MDTQKCDNCDTPVGPDDMFCENCGYDFITGSLPDGRQTGSGAVDDGSAGDPSADRGTDDAEPVLGTVGAAPSVLDPVGAGEDDAPGRVRVVIEADRDYFRQVVNDGEIDFPDPVPKPAELDLVGSEVHIGRTSESRAIHPDIDVDDLTGDQAVSSRHAVLRAADGGYTITDVGSTNGTFLGAIDSEAIAPGTPVDVEAGTPIYVGAWTRLTILN